MGEDLKIAAKLTAELDTAIASFDPSQRMSIDGQEPLGTPLPKSFFARRLSELAANRIPPQRAQFEKRDTVEEIGAVTAKEMICYLLTRPEDKYQLAYAPEEKLYLLVYENKLGRLSSIDIWGNAIDCYLAM